MEEQKQRFSEVIGGLVSGVAYARSVADREAMRIAYFYHQHELLKGMPVPRLRIQRMSISLPMVVSDVIPGAPAVRNPAVDIAWLATEELGRAIRDLEGEIAETQRLDTEGKTILEADAKDRVERFRKILELGLSQKAGERFQSSLVADIEHAYTDLNLREGSHPSDASLCDTIGRVTEAVIRQIFTEVVAAYVHGIAGQKNETFDPERGRKAIQEWMDDPLVIKVIRRVRHIAEEKTILKPTESPDFLVTVNTENVKNAGGGPDVVTRLDIVLKEEGLEWHSEERDGKSTSKLVPE